MSLVLYRKYRPKSFEEVVGQEKIIKILTSAVMSRRVAHAYLFTGPRGTGKTTIARILAKSINCKNLKKNETSGNIQGEPCNECINCVAINENKTFDIIEIDAASNTGVDNIRDLKATIGFSPSMLRYKVFIIDEAHMLSKGAFNALLKTLEEPPEHAVFILATTEIHKIPATIISRSQRFDFRKFRLSEMALRLEQIAKKEKVKLAKGVAETIAMAADGGMRDAESLLGQIISLDTDGKEISLEEVKSVLGLSDAGLAADFAEFLAQGKIKEAIVFLSEAGFSGQDMEQFANTAINIFRKLLILKSNPGLKTQIAGDSTEDQILRIMKLAESFSEQELLWLLKKLIAAKNEIRSAIIPQMPLELVIIEYNLLKNKKAVSDLHTSQSGAFSEKSVNAAGKKVLEEVKHSVSSEQKAEKKTVVAEEIKEQEIKINKEEKENQIEKIEEKSTFGGGKEIRDLQAINKEDQKKDAIVADILKISSGWSNVLKAAKTYNHSISAFLKMAAPKEMKEGKLIIATPYKFHSEKLSESANRQIIEKVINEVFPEYAGIKIQIIQDENFKINTAPAEAANEEKKAPDSSVQSAIDIFGGEVE